MVGFRAVGVLGLGPGLRFAVFFFFFFFLPKGQELGFRV